MSSVYHDVQSLKTQPLIIYVGQHKVTVIRSLPSFVECPPLSSIFDVNTRGSHPASPVFHLSTLLLRDLCAGMILFAVFSMVYNNVSQLIVRLARHLCGPGLLSISASSSVKRKDSAGTT